MLTQKLKSVLTNSLSLNQTKQVHALITTIGLLHQLESLLLRQTLLSTNIRFSRNVSLYVQRLLHSSNTDASQWSFAVRFFTRNGEFQTAFRVFVLMQRLSLSPISFALSSSLKACAKLGHNIGGLSVHSQAIKLGLSSSVYVLTSLMSFYAKTGDVKSAREVFDEMPEKNVVSWNIILAVHLRRGDLGGARMVFDEMPSRDAVSWNSMITGYARVGDMRRSIELFDRMPERELTSWNAMITGYAGIGDMGSASRVFEEMPTKNEVSWVAMISGHSKVGDPVSARSIFDRIGDKATVCVHNAMIACYEQNNRPKEAIELFNQMLESKTGIAPNELTLTSVVSACSQLGYMEFGLWVESYAKKAGIEPDDQLTNAFVDLYSKCGEVDKAYEIFLRVRRKDVVSYSSMISGFAANGRPFDAINLFKKMARNREISPNLVTYKGLLSACNHAGLVEEGCRWFGSMKAVGLIPSADHYGIMVDLLGRSGRVEEGYELINAMPVKARAGAWGALLRACRHYGNVALGEVCAKKCFELRHEGTGHVALLAGIYSSAERWEDAEELRGGRMHKMGLTKTPGCSWIESN